MVTINIVEAHELSRVFLGNVEVWAVNEVTLTVPRGQFVAVLGPSRSGKSSLLNLLGAQDVASMGRLVVDGVSVTNLRGDELADFRRQRVGHVAQVARLIPSLTVLRNVMVPLLPYRRALRFDLETRARELLDALDLGAHAAQMPAMLSEGEAQRVAIARALINTPPLLLLDEPFINLGRGADGAVLNLLDRLNREAGLSVILATREQGVAEVADRVVRMDKGRLLD